MSSEKTQDMKLNEIAEYDEPGTFAGVRFDPATVRSIMEFIKANNIPHPVEQDELHTTLLHSRKPLPNYDPIKTYESPMVGRPGPIEIWQSQPDGDGATKNVLVLTYQCSALYQRHHGLMHKHGATYDFDTYKPHVTFSYDPGDFDVEQLPDFEHSLTIIGEYSEDLKR